MKDTNKKIDELAAMMKGGFDEMGRRFDDLRTELKGDISAVRTELKGDILRVDNNLSSEASSIRSEISALRSEMHDGFMKTNDKVDLLTVKLQDKNVITKADAKEILAITPMSLS